MKNSFFPPVSRDYPHLYMTTLNIAPADKGEIFTEPTFVIQSRQRRTRFELRGNTSITGMLGFCECAIDLNQCWNENFIVVHFPTKHHKFTGKAFTNHLFNEHWLSAFAEPHMFSEVRSKRQKFIIWPQKIVQLSRRDKWVSIQIQWAEHSIRGVYTECPESQRRS